MKIFLRSIGSVGLVLFTILFWITSGVPGAVEESAKGFVRSQIEKEVRERYMESEAPVFADKVLQIAGELGYEE